MDETKKRNEIRIPPADDVEELMDQLDDEWDRCHILNDGPRPRPKTYAEILRDNPNLQHKGGLAQLAQPGVMDELLGFKPPREKMH